jgi:hypothetical protein
MQRRVDLERADVSEECTASIIREKRSSEPEKILVTGRGLCVFSVRYEHHLHIKKESYLCNRRWRSIGVFPARYEHHLHIKSKAIPITVRRGLDVVPAKHENHLHKNM